MAGTAGNRSCPRLLTEEEEEQLTDCSPFPEREDISVQAEGGLVQHDVGRAALGLGGHADPEDVLVGGEAALVQDVDDLVPLGLRRGVPAKGGMKRERASLSVGGEERVFAGAGSDGFGNGMCPYDR